MAGTWSRVAGSRSPARRGECGTENIMYTVYILQSLKNNRYYTGQTSNIGSRLETHNRGMVKSTKSFIPWKLIHTENYLNRSEACKRELEIKKYKGGILFKKLLGPGKN